jgi:D-alanyl-lipoteichoic acid acyltransferase DltB (MBOAT superfamily)
MIFNSIEFALFLPIVFGIYWLLNYSQVRFQNLFIICASYFFYGWWDWRFLALIAFSSFVDYFVGLQLELNSSVKRRKLLLVISLTTNLGFLGFFKYYNFFIDNLQQAYTLFGESLPIRGLEIVLPVGISFYTFQTLSYTIDIYRKKIEPTKDPIAFFAFVSFFPQLVAGPIERAGHLLPQFFKKREYNPDIAFDGVGLVIWGLFKKMVVADNCAIVVNEIFSNYGAQSWEVLLLGALFFSFQIYGDFSGYSDIAIGLSRMFGFDLMRNFALPYFSRDIAEFWRRWHISLSTWFRDYVYIPLGGSRVSKPLAIRNILIIFLVSGFWHGANWTFIIWGGLNALYFLPLLYFDKNRNHLTIIGSGNSVPPIHEIGGVIFTFVLTALAWIFFRSNTASDAFHYLFRIFSLQNGDGLLDATDGLVWAFIPMVAIEYWQREKEHPLAFHGPKARLKRWVVYYLFIAAIFFLRGQAQTFIYFQF